MTQEEKDIIYKDACGRLPYHPYAAYTLNNGTTYQVQLTGAEDGHQYIDIWGHIPDYDVKLYLRPMDSMTDEEKDYSLQHGANLLYIGVKDMDEYITWLNSHHFDYRDLIKKGLALKAPEDMYKL